MKNITAILSKQTILFLIGLLTLSTLFLPLTTLHAATLTNGMDAAEIVFGSTSVTQDFNVTGTTSISSSSGGGTYAFLMDEVNDRVFISSIIFSNRILVFNLNPDHTFPDYVADYVIGQDDFVSSDRSTSTQNGLLNPTGLAYDYDNDYLFVAESINKRVTVFDLSGGIINGMNASYVLGQEDFTSRVDVTDQDGVSSPVSVDFDPDNDHLFVSDAGNDRVLIYDLSGGITNGMNASYVLGQPDFVTEVETTTQNSLIRPSLMKYVPELDYLFVNDVSNYRTIVYDLAGGVTSTMNASYVLGQPDFVTAASNTPSDVYFRVSDAGFGTASYNHYSYDSAGQRLFVTDGNGNRILVYDLSGGITNGMAASYVLGQEDFATVAPNKGQDNPSQDSLHFPLYVHYSDTSDSLYVTEWLNNRVLRYDLSQSNSSQSSSSSFSYVVPPLCSAQFSPNTITEGESTTYSWNITWPTNNQNTYYVKVPGKDGGLFSSNVHSIQMTPEHTQTITTYTFNLWGATPCTETITVLDQEGNEILPTNKNNLTISAGASNHPFIRPFVLLFAKLFVR